MTPPTNTGLSRAVGVAAPVRPIWMSIASTVVVCSCAGNLCAIAQRGVRPPSAANPPGDQSCLSQQDLGRYREPHDRRGTASIAVMPRGSVLVGPVGGFTSGGNRISRTQVTSDGPRDASFDIIMRQRDGAFTASTCTIR